ncbi:MAG: FKBP-type peptidyl-prolyl cis-trans isomerase [bacterium]|nr:FKBP-type peptidyl-prolyl cis-trans isomerase [bacterium]MDZ4284722.1 FKBP-type peptidyl-prolyl cis-trans isomerase [Patescibacteria group bacterium]
MRSLSKNEWIAVVVGISVIGAILVFTNFKVALLAPSAEEKIGEIDQTAPMPRGGDTALDSLSGISGVPDESGLVIEEIKVGGGEEAASGMLVTVHYTGRLLNGRTFDSSLTRGEPFQFVLGSGQVIEGWERGILGMKVGGERVLVIPPALAYGEGKVGIIPPSSTLVFEVELLGVSRQ